MQIVYLNAVVQRVRVKGSTWIVIQEKINPSNFAAAWMLTEKSEIRFSFIQLGVYKMMGGYLTNDKL